MSEDKANSASQGAHTSLTNLDRLLEHLEPGSLAAALVNAYRDQDGGEPVETMKTILRKRLENERSGIANPEN